MMGSSAMVTGQEIMKHKKGAILALTRKGAFTGANLSRHLPGAVLYLPGRLEKEAGWDKCDVVFFQQWQDTVASLFHDCSYLIFVGAAGIAVRSTAPHLKGKYLDPAVIVVDEDGHYSISLLSGHLGGANQLARRVAQILSGQAVITTATDGQGFYYPPDVLSSQIGAFWEPEYLLKEINRLMAEGEVVNLYSPFPLTKQVKKDYCWQGRPVGNQVLEPAVAVTPYRWEFPGKVLVIKPFCLVVGIGCRKGVSLEAVSGAVSKTLHHYRLDARCLKALATADVKAEEKALQEYSQELQLPLIICSREDLAALKGTYRGSPRVEKELGVGGVCEPAARLAAERGSTLVPKQKHGQVTVSVALAKSWWWDWDRETGNY